MKYSSVKVMGYPVYNRLLSELHFDNRQVIINTLNAYSFVRAEEDEEFRRSLLASDILVADGFPIVMAARILHKQRIKKIAGADVFYFLLEMLNQNKGSCFFLGAAPSTLNMIKQRLNAEYPDIKVSSYSPPFKNEYSESEIEAMLSAINQSSPDVLFVGMTAPKQEKWVYRHKDKVQAKIICAIGAVFDFYAGTVKRPSAFWINLHLEWLARFVKEPGRLGKRYFVHSPRFFIYLVREFFRKGR